MALLQVLKYPDPKLKLVAELVSDFDSALKSLCADLLETMYAHDGIGLAATQVAVQQRIFVLDLSESRDQGICLINPVVTSKNGITTTEEGCLSFPDIYAKVKRCAEISLEYYDVEGTLKKIDANGLLAVCIQHELDHLDGITFFDHLSPLKKKIIRNKIEKQLDRAT